MKFTINLEVAEEGFIQNFKENRAERKKEKSRRSFRPDQKFSSIDEALTYAKSVYTGDNWPYYLDMDLQDKSEFVIYVRKWKDRVASVQEIQTCIDKARTNWKKVTKAVAEEFYENDDYASDAIDRQKVSKNQFVASCKFTAMTIFVPNGGKTSVEYEFHSDLMETGYIVEDMQGLGDFNGNVLPEFRD